MVVIDLAPDLAVSVDVGSDKPYSYTIIHGGEEIVQYESGADIRMPSGQTAIRNIIYRQVEGYEKKQIEELLAAELANRMGRIDETLEPE